jgi:branched-chain amino acid transport system permease protein
MAWTLPAIWMSAITYASMITILSLGFTLTHMTAKIPNFAHGTYAGFGVYVTWTLVRVCHVFPYYGFPLAFLLGGVIGIILYNIVVATLRRMGGGTIVLTIATIAIQIFLSQGLHIYAFWSRETFGLMSYGFLLKTNDMQIFGFQGIFVVSVLMVSGIVVALHWMLTRTKIGIAMKATAEDPGLASVLGIDINRIQILSWFLTGGMAALAGSMVPLWFMGSPIVGGGLLSSCMAGSLLGGLDNIYGAVLGGFSIGVVEIILTGQLQRWVGLWVGEYRPLVPMIATILVLLVEPAGMSGALEKWRIAGGTKRMMERLGRSSE